MHGRDVVVIRSATCLVVATLCVMARANPEFIPLGDLPRGENRSTAAAISADGNVVVGASSGGAGEEAFRWTPSGGMEPLGILTGYYSSRATAVNADGSVVAGQCYAGDGTMQAFRWTADGGMIGLGDLPGGELFSEIRGVSADGSVIVGDSRADGNQNRAFRWTIATGMVNLGTLPNGEFYFSYAAGVSADGSVIIGASHAGDGYRAFRWTESGGMESLGLLPGGYGFSWATAVSHDGSVIVGSSYSTDGIRCFRWEATSGMQALAGVPSQFNQIENSASAVSGDGKVVVGAVNGADFGWYQGRQEAFRWSAAEGATPLAPTDGGFFLRSVLPRALSSDGSVAIGIFSFNSPYDLRPFLWTRLKGSKSLYQLLTVDYELDLIGWSDLTADALSADGRVIVGSGRNPKGETEAWLARLPVIAPPASCPGDANNDAIVNFDDIKSVLTNWLNTCP